METNNLKVSDEEIVSLKDYIHQKNTAVLTIMFTDIKGFTQITEQKGEQAATELRKHHDSILTSIIEENLAGLVIKFVGDAVMAVFSEPSASVERAIRIQRRLREFNAEHPELDDIVVRIGMHMGQVAVDNNIQVDVFGRHVNRASRIESLADGGQIYLSYPVFDSAKGWLLNHPGLTWKSHGAYYLKGIKEPIEIYEVIEKAFGTPKPPLSGKKKRSFPGLVALAAVAILAALVTAALLLYQQTEVWFVSFYPERMYLDQQKRIILMGEKTDQARKTKDPISPGKHILHYAITDAVRYYTEVDIHFGKNNIEPEFKELRLPSLENRIDLTETMGPVEKTKSFEYDLYDDNGKKIAYKADLSLTLESRKDDQNPDLIHDRFRGKITLNGKEIPFGPVTNSHSLTATHSTRVEPVTVFEDERHSYYYKYYVYKTTFDVSLSAKFKPMKPQ